MLVAVYVTLYSPQFSVFVFVPNVDVTFISKSWESENIGSFHETFATLPSATVVRFSGHVTSSGDRVSVKTNRKITYKSV